MNEALQKFLQLSKANFWDRQFYVFFVFSFLFLALYFLRPKISLKFSEFIEKFSGQSDVRNYLLIAAFNVLLCCLIVLINGIPIPQTHDEFAYLLAADTFLQGRIVNPTPFSPAHFEYFHILVKPVYAAKYPPLQGFLLAVGQLLTGYPVAGVWLSGVLSSLAVYWFLRYFFTRGWALYGAVLWIFAPLNMLWLDSYWGAHAAVIGGALSLGAFFRFLKSADKKYLFVWGAGIFILLNSRLYEGALLTGILVLGCFFDALKNKKIGKTFYSSVAVFVLIGAANLLFVGFYNYQVTGDPLVLPYRMHHSQYHRTPLFVFEKLDEPKPDAPTIVGKLDEQWSKDFQERYRNWKSALFSTFSRIPIYLFWLARSPFLIAFFLAGLFFAWRKTAENDWKIALSSLGLFTFGLVLTNFTGDRFVAPLIGIYIVLTTLGARIVYRKSGFLRLWVWSLPLIVGIGFLYGMIPVKSNSGQKPINPENLMSRAEIENFLKSQSGKHLVFSETAESFPADARFYVYNRAGIENALIVWAHKLSEEENAALVQHFKDRNVWLLRNVEHRAVLVKYENQK